MSYSVYECDYSDIFAFQKMSVAMDDPVEIWDVRIKTTATAPVGSAFFPIWNFPSNYIVIKSIRNKLNFS